MKRAGVVVSIILLVVAFVGAAYYYYVVMPSHIAQEAEVVSTDVTPEQEVETPVVSQPEADVQEGTTIAEPGVETNKISLFCEDEEEEINPLIYGKWQSTTNPQWYKVYTDEYSGNGYYWGKEWDETEDITEDDLIDYGNGWYEWKMNKNELIELATTDMNSTRIPVEYKIKVTEQSLEMVSVTNKKTITFIRVQ